MSEAPVVLGHEQVLRGLWRAAREGRLPHALLFCGPAGIGKFAAARRLVQGLMCERDSPEGPCGTCPACKRVITENHLDVFLLDVAHEDVADDKRQDHIRLDRIVRRQGPTAWDGPVIEEFLSLRAAEGGWRALVVREAERLRHSQNEAQNALLKMLEEPGQRVLWVLETSRPEALLPTVRSRCVAVRLDTPSPEQALAVLARNGVEGAEAQRLARWAGGAPGAALALQARAAAAFRTVIEDLLGGNEQALGRARVVWEAEGRFQGKTPSARARDQARAFLDLALEVVADQLRFACGAAASGLAHGDLCRPDSVAGEARLRAVLDALLTARSDLDRNLDPQVLVDEALIALGGLTAGVGGRP